MSLIEGGSYLPLYGVGNDLVKVDDFLLDNEPITISEFVDFVKEHPKWRRSKLSGLFADKNYLSHWVSDLDPSDELDVMAPITNVSWFVARAYCQELEKRLPTVDEWEYAAMADETRADARVDPAYNQRILSWYETPRSFMKKIGQTEANYWGVSDLHGLVWEWTEDFNSVLISGESRKDLDTDSNLFCGSASIGATDLMNYAAFMRYAFRGSVKANYAVRNLGFRCAK